jgi:hypothetical protein
MKKVTEEELAQIVGLRDTLVEIITTIGELHLNEFSLKSELGSIQKEISQQEDRFVSFQETERVLFEKLKEKYGPGKIDYTTGEISE